VYINCPKADLKFRNGSSCGGFDTYFALVMYFINNMALSARKTQNDLNCRSEIKKVS